MPTQLFILPVLQYFMYKCLGRKGKKQISLAKDESGKETINSQP